MPGISRKNVKDSLLWIWFVLALLAAAWAHIAFGIGAFHLNPFDGSLFLLQSMYAALGLRPYVDYGFLYPPGPALLFGKLLHLSEIPQVNAAVSILNFALVSTCAAAVIHQAKLHRQFLGGLVFFCLGTVIPMTCMRQGIDPCPISMSCLTLLLALGALRKRSLITLSELAAAAALTTLWRWDKAIPLMVILALGAAIPWLLAAAVTRGRMRLRWISRRLIETALAGLTGAAVGLVLVALYGFITGSWAAEWEFVFHLPLLILPFRQLPIPPPSGVQLQWAADGIAMIMLGSLIYFDASEFRSKRLLARPIGLFALLAGPLSLLPYSFNRADTEHFLPLSAALMTAWIASASFRSRESRKTMFLMTAALFLVLLPLSFLVIPQARIQGFWPKDDVLQSDLKHSTEECSALIPASSRSLFVGQVSYSKFVSNLPVLYLAHPELRPATAFISDEPGVQNSCFYGSRIAGELASARRPLILALDSLGRSESNLTAHLANCGKIEAELSSMHALPLGSCRIAEHIIVMKMAR